MKEKLKPCLFHKLGNQLEIIMSFGRYEHYVECCNKKCKVHINTILYKKEKQAIAAWNKRINA